MRAKFEEQMQMMHREIISMGALCENAIGDIAETLNEYDTALLLEVKDLERDIDQKERFIEALCMKILMQQQPVASDLRQISAVLKILTDMERIGDQSVDIAEIITLGNLREQDEDKNLLIDMANASKKMVNQCIDALVKMDVDLAKEVIEYDDVVDDLFDQVKKVLVHHISVNEHDLEHIVDVLMISKYLERIGDHAVNIAEWVIFAKTGVHKAGETL